MIQINIGSRDQWMEARISKDMKMPKIINELSSGVMAFCEGLAEEFGEDVGTVVSLFLMVCELKRSLSTNKKTEGIKNEPLLPRLSNMRGNP